MTEHLLVVTMLDSREKFLCDEIDGTLVCDLVLNCQQRVRAQNAGRFRKKQFAGFPGMIYAAAQAVRKVCQ